MNPTYIMFAVYLLVMLAVGFVFVNKIHSTGEYFLGGRKVGAWVTALSAQASDMSGWLLMGLPGVVYCAGMGETWIAIGLMVGTILNWILIAPRLRIYTEKNDSVTLSSFFAVRFREKSNLLRFFSSVVILLFFTIYAASGLVAAGKLFESMFNLDYQFSVLIGVAVILIYTLLGGYLAVCWTDLIQGSLMFFALIAVPVGAYMGLSSEQFQEAFVAKDGVNPLSLLPAGAESWNLAAIGMIISSAVWGLGYCGQPHILTRFMSIENHKLLTRSTWIASVWVVISLAAAVMIGFLARPYFPGLDAAESEKVFIKLIGVLFNPWLAGILLAAILAAIMSTIDSQLLVSSSALTEDFYKKILRKNASVKEQVWVSRVCVLLITVLATILALSPNDTIFAIVKFAWGGFGAAFGPVVIMALYSRKTSWQSALMGMLAGFIVMIAWYFVGLGVYVYEILPGFIAGLVTIWIMNFFFPQDDEDILDEFDSVVKTLSGE